MCKKQVLRDLVSERLQSAAEEIFALIEKAFAEYEAEIVRLKWAKLEHEQKCAHQQQDVPTPLLHPEVIPEHKVEEQPTLCSALEFGFPPLPLKSEDDVHKSFLQHLPVEQNGLGSTGQTRGEPVCSLDWPSNGTERPYSSSDTDDSEDWDNSAQNNYSEKDRKSKKRRKRQRGIMEAGVNVKKVGEDLDTCVQNAPFSGTAETPFNLSLLNDDLPESFKPVNCPECGIRLRRQHSLERHISAVHRREKPFRCTVCEKGFARKSDCGIHMRVHTGERPYSCPVCQKTFNAKASLRRHVNIHKAQAGSQRNETQ